AAADPADVPVLRHLLPAGRLPARAAGGGAGHAALPRGGTGAGADDGRAQLGTAAARGLPAGAERLRAVGHHPADHPAADDLTERALPRRTGVVAVSASSRVRNWR